MAIARPPSNGTAATISSSSSATSIEPVGRGAAVELGEAHERAVVLRRGAAQGEALAGRDGLGGDRRGLVGSAECGGGGLAIGDLGGGDG